MQQKNTNKAIKQESAAHSVRKLAVRISGLAVVTLVLAGMVVLGYFAYWDHRELNSLSANRTANLIVDAAEGLHQPMPVDVQTSRYVVPQQRLALPMDSNRMSPEYGLDTFDDGHIVVRVVAQIGYGEAKSKLLTSNDVKTAFSYVPELRACLRGYTLSVDKADSTLGKSLFTKSLNDGRTLHAYIDSGCGARDSSFEQYLQQINSY
jgi:hypothetical protein